MFVYYTCENYIIKILTKIHVGKSYYVMNNNYKILIFISS